MAGAHQLRLGDAEEHARFNARARELDNAFLAVLVGLAVALLMWTPTSETPSKGN